MPITEVNLPSGRVMKVNHPEGATTDDILAYAKSEYSTTLDNDNLLIDAAKTFLSGGVQAAVNTGAGIAQSYGMMLGPESDTSEEAIQEYVARQAPGSRMTAGKVRAHREAKNKAVAAVNENAHRMRELANSMDERLGVDQDFAESLPGQIVRGFGQVPVSLAALAVGGIPGVVATAAPQMITEAINDAEQTLKKPLSEMDNEEKNQVALSTFGYVTLGTALETAGFLKTVPGLRRFIFGQGKLTSGQLKSLKREVAEGFAGEGFTEAGQGQLKDAFASATYDDDRELMSMEVLGRRFNEFIVGGVVGGGTAGGFGAFERAATGRLFQPKTEDQAPDPEQPPADVGDRGEIPLDLKQFKVTYTDKLTGQEMTQRFEAFDADQADTLFNDALGDVFDPDIGVVIEEETKSEGADLEEPKEDVTVGAMATYIPQRFVGERAEAAPPFFRKFQPEQYDEGRFVDLETTEDLSDQTFEGGSIRIEGGRPVLETSDTSTESIMERKASKEGALVRSNLFKQKAGWKWTQAPEGEPSTIVSVEQGNKHYYTLDFTSGKPLTLKTYPDKKSEPRGRPTTRGEVKLGNKVGEIDVRGKKHPVYDRVTVGEPEVVAEAATVGAAQQFGEPLPDGELPTSMNDKLSNDVALDSRPTYDRVQAEKSTVTKAGQPKKGYFEKLADLVSSYDFFPEGAKSLSVKGRVDQFIDFVEKNVLYLYDTMDAEIRERTKLWYDGANHIARGFADRYGISKDEAAGVLAVLSPQKDWFQNVSLAERVLDAWYNRDSIPAWGSEMDTTATRIWKPKDKPLIDRVRGKKLSELSDPVEQAAWLRTYDETFNDRKFAVITPEGGILPPSGKSVGWGSTDMIAKTFLILNNPNNKQALSNALGNMHKVRNFYNNIAYPNSENGYATMDTHAIAAGMFFPVGGNHKITAAGLGGSPTRGPAGLYGTYPLFLEAYTRAAKKRGVLPREMQSITWEQIRTLFTNKSKPKLDFATKTWKTYSNGEITYEEAIDKIIKNHGGFGEPTWVESSAGVDVFLGNPTYEGPVSSTGISGPELQVGTAGSGRTRGVTEDVSVGAAQQQEAAQNQVIGDAITTTETVAQKIGAKVQARNDISRDAQYNYETRTIEYNPELLARRGPEGAKAAMREEVIHAAMHKVLMDRSKGKTPRKAFEDFFQSVGKSMTPEQRSMMEEVYGTELDDLNNGAEYTRFLVQSALDGRTTEETMTVGPAFAKVQALIKSVQAYATRIFGKDLEQNREVAFVIADSMRLLQSFDPQARPVNQKIVSKAEKIASRLDGTGEVDTEVMVNAANPPSKKKDINFFDKYIFTASTVLQRISPEIARLFNKFFYRVEKQTLDHMKRVQPFIKKYNAIKNQADKKKLKQLLMYSPDIDPRAEERQQRIAERTALLRKYDMLNDYNLRVRPVLDILRTRANQEGMEVPYLNDYFPRQVIDLDKIREFYGEVVVKDFSSYIERINELRRKNDEAIIQRGSNEEALEFDKYIRSGEYTKRGVKPRNTKQRTIEFIEDEISDAYADPGPALETYIHNMVLATETMRLLGRRYEVEGENVRFEKGSLLSTTLQKLEAEGKIDSEQAFRTIPHFAKIILNPVMKENPFLAGMRSFSYFTLLVEPTTTLSQLFDLPFQMYDKGFFPVLSAGLGKKTFRLGDVGIDNEQVSAEFKNEKKWMAEAVRLGLKSTGFTRLDQLMKETAMQANYNRYRKLARGYYKNRNSNQSKKFKTELEFIMGDDADKAIAALKKGDRNNALVRELIRNKLLETQPISRMQQPLIVSQNPNTRSLFLMKSFMVTQLNFVVNKMLSQTFGKNKTKQQRLQGATDLAKLMFFMLMIGMPVDALKDLLAGRLGYMSDYVLNGIFRVAGISRYQMYVARKEGVGQAALDYVTPVGIQQAVDITAELQRVVTRDRAITDSKLVTLAPFSDVINRIFGFSREREEREYERRAGEGDLPTFIPPGAL